jgi:hypothetical protein
LGNSCLHCKNRDGMANRLKRRIFLFILLLFFRVYLRNLREFS